MTHRLRDDPIAPPLARALAALASDPIHPSPDVEAHVLAAFDRAHALPSAAPSRGLSRVWLSLAASLILATGVSLWTVRSIAVPGRTAAAAAPVARAFVEWPGAADLPSLESGQLVRVDLPVSLLPTLGIVPPEGAATQVQADVLVGQDGLARAVRLVSIRQP
ncbi:MAG TPA: hypothetical protein VFX12_10410 [Vicinamibacterales bacterium]|nr:hypothetical protein [Vicinamibacterales bacterium]